MGSSLLREMRYIIQLFCGVLLVHVLASSCKKSNEGSERNQFHRAVTLEIDSLHQQVEDHLLPAVRTATLPDSLQHWFFECRLRYKGIEHLVEYYSPASAKGINGPPLDDLEVEEHRVFEPEGFQVLEELLFPWDSVQRKEAIRHAGILLVNINRVKTVWENTTPTHTQLFDAIRLQIFRILSLGLSGFDSPIAKNSIPEAVASLQGLQHTLKMIEDKPGLKSKENLNHELEKAIAYLQANRDFNKFDRAVFITRFANPISRHLTEFRNELRIPPVTEARLLLPDAVTFFDNNAFNVNYYSSDVGEQPSQLKIDLGKSLFYDPILSTKDGRSCGSCHRPEKAFTDGLTKSTSLTGRPILRNTPTLLNAAFQNFQFYDMRSATLEAQAQAVVENQEEMHGSLSESVKRLSKHVEYKALFHEAFGTDSITTAQLQYAIASYVRSLVSLNSPFDRYMRGDSSQLTKNQVDGFNLFMGKAQCGICHFMPLFNGTVPPTFADTESEVIGVPSKVEWSNATIDSDPGRYAIFEMEQLRHAFKTPTVRNASVTAPYMHNGVYRSLEEVIKFYNKGGGAGIGIDLPNQTLPSDSLGLTETEQKNVIEFIHALTDTTGLSKAPALRKNKKLLSVNR